MRPLFDFKYEEFDRESDEPIFDLQFEKDYFGRITGVSVYMPPLRYLIPFFVCLGIVIYCIL